MIILKKKHDCSTHKKEEGISRRDFIGGGLTSLVLPTALLDAIVQRDAMAAAMCGSSIFPKVGFAQISYDQGPYWNMFGPIAPNGQVHSATDITRFGLKWGYSSGTNMNPITQNAPVNASDAWGDAFLKGPFPNILPPNLWQIVLADVGVSLGHVNRNDDGGGQSEPGSCLGVVSTLKAAQINSNFNFGNNLTQIQFAPRFANLNVQQNTLSMAQAITFPGANLTSEAFMRATLQGAEKIGDKMSPLRATKFAAEKLFNNFACAFNESPAKASATYGTTIFDAGQFAAKINALIPGAAVTAAQLTALPAAIQAHLSGGHASAEGTVCSISTRSTTQDEHAVNNANREANRINAAQRECALILGMWLSTSGTGMVCADGAGSAGGSDGFTTSGTTGATTANNGNDNGSETTAFHTLVVKRGSGGIAMKHLGFRNADNGNVNRTNPFGASIPKLALSRGILFCQLAGLDMQKVADLARKGGLDSSAAGIDSLNPMKA